MRSLWKRLLTGMIALALIATGLPMQQVLAAENSETYLLNYLVIEKPYIEAPDAQKIVVSIGGEEAVYQNPVLVYRNQETNEVFDCAADTIDGNTALFAINHEQEENAVYVLIEIRFEAEGRERTIAFEECGMNTQYGVNMEAGTSEANAVIVSEESVGLDITVTDAEGNTISNDTFGEALNRAETTASAVARYTAGINTENEKKETEQDPLVVVIDPGHDKTHSGANYFGVNEQQLTLKIAKYCKAELETYKNVKVYLTRETEECAWGNVTTADCLNNRADFAEEKGADVFVSIHLNADDGSGKAYGAEVYYPNPNYRPDISEEGAGLAENILEKLGNLGITKRGIQYQYVSDNDPKYNLPDGSRGDKYAVIRECKKKGIPGLIVEHAFLSNSGDYNNYLNSDAKLQKLGAADATAIAEYYDLKKGIVTVYDGVDYSPVYNYEYYIGRYADLKQIFGDDPQGALSHFVTFGMQEGRKASENFDVNSYRNQYQDLRRAFGKNRKSYYLHYITNGRYEGRITTGVTELQNAVTVYDGVDYSAVYDFNYYTSRHADIKQIYGDDEYGALSHFITFGMKEGRQAKADFNVTYYRSNYADLERVFGDDLAGYYHHYMQYGKREGREASKEFYYSIMGTSSTTVEKMAAYYKDRYTYPAFYANTEAPTVEDFCRIYMEECNAEGVRVEVAFCQSMKETGFLQYPGASCVVKPEQYNFAGLDTTGAIYEDGTVDVGRSYPDVRTGIRAHVQRLKAYAAKGTTPESFAYECIDPDKYTNWWVNTIVGSAPYVEWLGKEQNPSGYGWATDPEYGYSIKKDYLAKLLNY